MVSRPGDKAVSDSPSLPAIQISRCTHFKEYGYRGNWPLVVASGRRYEMRLAFGLFCSSITQISLEPWCPTSPFLDPQRHADDTLLAVGLTGPSDPLARCGQWLLVSVHTSPLPQQHLEVIDPLSGHGHVLLVVSEESVAE